MIDNTLNAIPREGLGKGPARQLRFRDKIPGVFYYRGEINVPVSVDSVELRKLMKNKPALINLNIEGHDARECVFRDLQRDPVTDAILHFDLMGIKRGQKLTVTVTLRLVGVPEGVRTGGGILQSNMNEVEIECLPKHIPSFIELDVSDLEIGQSRHVRDLELENIRLLYEPDEVIASVVPPSIMKEVVEVEEEEEEAGEEAGEAEEKTEEPEKGE